MVRLRGGVGRWLSGAPSAGRIIGELWWWWVIPGTIWSGGVERSGAERDVAVVWKRGWYDLYTIYLCHARTLAYDANMSAYYKCR